MQVLGSSVYIFTTFRLLTYSLTDLLITWLYSTLASYTEDSLSFLLSSHCFLQNHSRHFPSHFNPTSNVIFINCLMLPSFTRRMADPSICASRTTLPAAYLRDSIAAYSETGQWVPSSVPYTYVCWGIRNVFFFVPDNGNRTHNCAGLDTEEVQEEVGEEQKT